MNAANQGLLEAKGVTQEQAIQLIGCVTRVTQAESKIDAANEALRSALKNDMQGVVAQCDERLGGRSSSFVHLNGILSDAKARPRIHGAPAFETPLNNWRLTRKPFGPT